jgi:hypothetical protein
MKIAWKKSRRVGCMTWDAEIDGIRASILRHRRPDYSYRYGWYINQHPDVARGMELSVDDAKRAAEKALGEAVMAKRLGVVKPT